MLIKQKIQKSIIKQKLKFKDYRNFQKAKQPEDEVGYLDKI